MARSAGRERTVCEACELPYYADEDECPYCGTEESGFVFGTVETAGRSRTTCPDCGLPRYEDADECPYCAFAASGPAVEPTRPEPIEPESAETGARTADDEDGFFGRLKRTLGF
jgi:RNA polymerase subunit RPABC4/transcription elongation factor Spt4